MKDRFNNKIIFWKPTFACRSNTSKYVPLFESTIIPDPIHALATGEGIASCLQFKCIALTTSGKMQNSWTTSKELLATHTSSNYWIKQYFNKIFFNFIAWIVSPKSSMDRNGFLKLSPHKAWIVQQFHENIQAAVSFTQPLLSQVLVSLASYAETGSRRVIKD